VAVVDEFRNDVGADEARGPGEKYAHENTPGWPAIASAAKALH
jgi:hypothetical protein